MPQEQVHEAAKSASQRMDDEAFFDALVGQIYAAAAGRVPWEQPLRVIVDTVGAFIAQLAGYDLRQGGVAFSHVAGYATPEGHLAYLRHYHRLDPRTPLLLHRAQVDHWVHCHELVSEEQVARDPYYQEFLIPNGVRYSSGVKLFQDEELAVVLAVQRGVGRTPLEPATLRWLDRLRVHFVEAVGIYRHVAALQQQSAAGQALLDMLPHPMLLIDASRGLRHGNAAAQRELDAARCVVRRSGLLGCRRPDDDVALNVALHELFRGPPNARRYLRIRHADSDEPVGLCLSRLEPEQVMGAFGPLSQAMVLLHDTSRPMAPDPFLIGEVFELTPAEAQVAVRLVEGRSVDEIAAERGVAAGTVRTQVRTLLAKTGTNRQVDLVLRLARLERFGEAQGAA